MSVNISQEEDRIRIRADREGERAVSSLLTRDEAEAVVTQLAGMLGLAVSPAADSEPPAAPTNSEGAPAARPPEAEEPDTSVPVDRSTQTNVETGDEGV